MAEHLKKYYQKEEEFLDEFSKIASTVSEILKGKWEPNYDCNDKTRRNIKYFLESGELDSLVFDGASVYHEQGCFSSAQVTLKSSKRTITIRVRLNKGKFKAEIL